MSEGVVDPGISSRARRAFGAPGIAPRWTPGSKDAIGTAYSAGSTVWFTVSAGILNEVYYLTIDRPQIRDRPV
jgi:glucoamylase